MADIFSDIMIGIHKGEWGVVLRLGFHSYLMVGAAVFMAISSEGMFIAENPPRLLPFVFLGGALFSLAIAFLYEKLQGRFRPVGLAVTVALGLVCALFLLRGILVFQPRLGPWLLFLFAPTVGTLVGLESSGFMSRLLDTRSGRRLFPTIGIFSGMGAVTAGLAVGLLSPVLGPREMVWFSMGFLLLSIPLVRGGKKSKRETPRGKPASWKRVIQNRFAFLLIMIVSIALVVGNLARYQLGAAMKDSLEPDQIASFLGYLRAGLNLTAVLFQLLLARIIIGRLGIGTTLGIYPAGILGAATVSIFFPILGTVAAIQFVERLFRQNLLKPISYIAVMPLAGAIRSKASLAVRGALDPPMTLLSCGILLIAAPFVSWAGFSWPIAILGCLGLICAWFARSHYSSEVASALQSRRFRDTGDLEEPQTLDAAARKVLHDQLKGEVPENIALAIQLLERKFTTETISIISRQWSTWDSWVKKEAILHLREDPLPQTIKFLKELTEEEPDEVQAELLRSRILDLAPADFERRMSSDHPLVAAEAMVIALHENGLASIRTHLIDWIESGGKEIHASAAYVIGKSGDSTLLKRLPGLVEDTPHEVALALSENPDPLYARTAIECLGDDDAFLPAREALVKMGPSVFDEILRVIRDPRFSASVISILGDLEPVRSRKILFDLLSDKNDEIRYRAMKTLTAGTTISESEKEFITAGIEEELDRAIHYREELEEGDILRQEEARENFDWSSERIFLMLGLIYPGKPFRSIYLSFVSEDSDQKSFSLEALDEILGTEWRNKIVSALEGGKREKGGDTRVQKIRMEKGGEKDPDLVHAMEWKQTRLFRAWRMRDLVDLSRLSRRDTDGSRISMKDGDRDQLRKTLLGELGGSGSGVSLEAIFDLVSERPRCGAAWLKGLAGERSNGEEESRVGGDSFDSRFATEDHVPDSHVETWDRIFALRSVPLFHGLSPDRLKLVAEISHSVTVDAEEMIIRAGENGNRFYVVDSGSVQVLRKDREVAILSAGEAFGEISMLSGGRRSATVRTLERSELLVIDRVDFLDLLYTHPALVRPFTEMIARRMA